MEELASLRLSMVVHTTESLETAVRRLDEWVSNFDALGFGRPPSCLWVTGVSPDYGVEDVGGHCVHTLAIPEGLDRYVRTWNPRTPRSPWGLKSGPNFQFFRIISAISTLHREQWSLQLESDVVPLRPVKKDDFIGEFRGRWVVGAHNHPEVLNPIDPMLWGHINGSAFYRVGDPDFIEFIAAVWIPSLLYLLHENPTLAYDCMTAPPVWASLPAPLREAWLATRDQFSFSSGMINASSLSKKEAESALRSMNEMPWFLHAQL
jgi:hypothetical protein